MCGVCVVQMERLGLREGMENVRIVIEILLWRKLGGKQRMGTLKHEELSRLSRAMQGDDVAMTASDRPKLHA